MSENNKSTLLITNGAVEMLFSALGASGWTSKRKELTAAGKLADRLEVATETRPIYKGEMVNGNAIDPIQAAAFRKTIKDWERALYELILTDPEFQACVSCLRHFTDEKRLPANYHCAVLLTEFKLTE